MAKVELKQPIVQEIASNVEGAQAVVLVQYSGISVENDTKMRKELREAGITYKVYKNTMMNFAFKDTPCEELSKHLEGQNAIAISADDATAPARILSKYAKSVPTLEFVAGIIEGNYCDKAGVSALASVPSREELLSKLLGSMQSPISTFARVLSQIAEAGDGAAAPAAEEAPVEEAKEEAAPVAEEAPAVEAVEEKAEEAAPVEAAEATPEAPTE
jgi:Ribosomal protein L10